MTIDQMLCKEMDSLAEDLKGLDPESKEYEIKSKRLDNLITKAIEMDKTYLEAELKRDQIENEKKKVEAEHEHSKKQLDDENKDRIVKNILQGLGIALPIIVTVWGTNKSLKFEETGTVTTMAGRGFISKLFPKK